MAVIKKLDNTVLEMKTLTLLGIVGDVTKLTDVKSIFKK